MKATDINRDEYRRAAYAMLYLAACAVNGRTPSDKKLRSIDLDKLFVVCGNHKMTSVVSFALSSAGIKDQRFMDAQAKTIRNTVLFSKERKGILDEMEQAGIAYMPLKGSVLKDYYPKFGMREMCDNDILYDGSHSDDLKDIMLGRGFYKKYHGNDQISYDDCYMKQPIFNFEMHHDLFNEAHSAAQNVYYENVWDRLVRDEGKEYGYHFTDEDFYLYMLAHEYKHYCGSGTGTRSLLDTYIVLKHFEGSLDWQYIAKEAEKLDMTEFESNNRTLAMSIFSFQKLDEDQKELLDYYIFSGVYGNIANRVNNKLARWEKQQGKSAKVRYLLTRLFKPMDEVKAWYPFFYRHKYLLPVLFLYRIGKMLTVKRKLALTEMKILLGRQKSEKSD